MYFKIDVFSYICAVYVKLLKSFAGYLQLRRHGELFACADFCLKFKEFNVYAYSTCFQGSTVKWLVNLLSVKLDERSKYISLNKELTAHVSALHIILTMSKEMRDTYTKLCRKLMRVFCLQKSIHWYILDARKLVSRATDRNI